ncbi:hypothetical protein L5515_001169 [Caenorhabditis briggsae]|uniref:Uncharacterized protein n=1 Tax=Caenorhabditis briggsae TaxID=6238 RepID=A0AAE9E0P5_CAEBR|nr:hypothetical protein L5515_001169 [Caenorhabditis briggsae]
MPSTHQLAEQARGEYETQQWRKIIGESDAPPPNVRSFYNFDFLAKSPKKEIIEEDASYGTMPVKLDDIKQEMEERKVEKMNQPVQTLLINTEEIKTEVVEEDDETFSDFIGPTFFDLVYNDIKQNPLMNIDYIIARNHSAAAGALYLSRARAIANWDNCLHVKKNARELKGLKACKTAGVLSSALPVTGKRERVKTTRQIEAEEWEARRQAEKKAMLQIKAQKAKAAQLARLQKEKNKEEKKMKQEAKRAGPMKRVRTGNGQDENPVKKAKIEDESNKVLSNFLTEVKPLVVLAVVEKKPRHVSIKKKTLVDVVPEKKMSKSVDPVTNSPPEVTFVPSSSSVPVAANQPAALVSAQPSTPVTKRKQPKSKKTTQKLICTVCSKTAGAGTCQCFGCAGWVHFRCSNGGYKNYTTSFKCAPCLAATVPAPSSD